MIVYEFRLCLYDVLSIAQWHLMYMTHDVYGACCIWHTMYIKHDVYETWYIWHAMCMMYLTHDVYCACGLWPMLCPWLYYKFNSIYYFYPKIFLLFSNVSFWCSNCCLLISHGVLMHFYDWLMTCPCLFVWFVYDFLYGVPKISYCFFSYDYMMWFLWFPHDAFMVFLWY